MPSLAPSTAALLLADARLPSGAHAHSAGVEPALMAGVSPADLPALLRGRAHTVTLVEAGTAVAARHARLAGADVGAGLDHPLDRVEAAWAARTPSRAQRDAARVLARGYLRVGAELLSGDEVLAAWRARATPPPRPCVLGVIAAGLGIAPLELARLVVYEDLQAAAAAVLKLEPRDPLELVTLVARLCGEVEPDLAGIAAITDPDDIPALSAPQSEAWAETHARSNRRLFRA